MGELEFLTDKIRTILSVKNSGVGEPFFEYCDK